MRLNIGVPVVRTDGRAYGHTITKFFWMGRFPHFLSYGATSRARGAPQKITEKIIRENAFEHKKKISANRPSNNWALINNPQYKVAVRDDVRRKAFWERSERVLCSC